MGEETKDTNFEKYISNTQRFRQYPKNAFEHASHLIDSGIDKVDEKGRFSMIIDKDILCANISSDDFMRLLQIDATLLTHMYGMGQREPCFEMVFLDTWHGWRSGLQLTRTKNGGERKHQAQVGTSYQPKEQLYGYGQDMYPQAQQGEEGKGNIIKQILGGLRGKRDQERE